METVVFPRLHRSIPTLDDDAEIVRKFIWFEIHQPFRFDQSAFGWNRPLLILGGEYKWGNGCSCCIEAGQV